MAKSKSQTFDFEATLNELNQIVEQMENGKLTLEDSLEKFERGIKMARECQATLKAAEQKVQILMQSNEQAKLADFSVENNS